MERIGLIENPRLLLEDERGRNWTSYLSSGSLSSKLLVGGTLIAAGYEVCLYNLERGKDRTTLGEVAWNGHVLQKIVLGTPWHSINPHECDVWGITANFHQEEEIVASLIRYLTEHGARVVVGGSAAFAEPQKYTEMGAAVVVLDKSGGSNVAAIEIALTGSTKKPHRLYLARQGESRVGVAADYRLHPEKWPLPPISFVKETLGDMVWQKSFPTDFFPIGTIMADQGCDQKCDFCQSWKYGLGYQWMSPERIAEWILLLKKAGAGSIDCTSDQFVARNLWKHGRDEIMAVVDAFKAADMPFLWRNGIELKKITMGRGIEHDLMPDRDLIRSLFGWDGKRGCVQTYIAGERPIDGTENYRKLLPWQQHLDMLRAIIETGIPDIFYGVILGLPDDSNETYKRLEEGLHEIRDMTKEMNPSLTFSVHLNGIQAFPGTLMTENLQDEGLMPQNVDPALINKQTPVARTRHLSVAQLSEWQRHLYRTFVDSEGRRGVTCFT